MEPEEDALLGLAGAVADGSAIDWDHVADKTAEAQQRNILEQLQLIAKIAEHGRDIGPEPPDEQVDALADVPTITNPEESAGSIRRWGNLALIEQIGSGAFGTVYRAHDAQLDRPVAVKLLQRDPGSSNEQLASRLLTEGRALASVNHPNVVKVYGAEEHDGQVGLCMEFIRGVTLEEMLVSHGPFSAGEAGLIGSELCGALAAVHYAGLVHRDIKAQNIMRQEGGRLVLMDFGTGQKRISGQGTPARIQGTPFYLAPEILEGGEATDQSDIYSLGVLLYHLVTGDFPVKASALDELKEAHKRGRVTQLEVARPDLPEDFVRIVARATHRDPGKRFPRADSFRAAFARLPGARGSGGGTSRLRPPSRKGSPIGLASKGTSVPSVAVLPFSDMSPAKDQESFCDGMTEEIINALTQISGLRVAARTSTFQFKGRSMDVRQIGDALKVGAILDGSVRKHHNQLRITVDLIGAGDGYVLWSKRFDRGLEDIFAIQDDIANSIAAALKGQLSASRPAAQLAPRSNELGAYVAYLEGRYHWNKRTEESLKKSVGCFELAVSRDPTFAPALAGLADAYVTLGTYGCVAAMEVMPLVTPAVERALALDANLAEAYTCRACVRAVYDWSWADAENDFRHAIDVNPSYPTAHHWYAINHLVPMGRFDEATEELRRALELDPLALAIKTSVGMKSYFAGKHDDAVRELAGTIELDRGFGVAHLFLGAAYTELAMYPEALQELELAMNLSGRNAEILAALGYLHGNRGDVDAARQILAELQRLAAERYVSPARLAQVHVGLGEQGEALARLEQARAERAVDLAWLGVRPVFARLHREPRFGALVQAICPSLQA